MVSTQARTLQCAQPIELVIRQEDFGTAGSDFVETEKKANEKTTPREVTQTHPKTCRKTTMGKRTPETKGTHTTAEGEDYGQGKDSASTARGTRRNFDKRITGYLEWVYRHKRYPNHNDRQYLSQHTGLSSVQVKTWFQNRRLKEKTRGSGKTDNSHQQPDLPQLSHHMDVRRATTITGWPGNFLPTGGVSVDQLTRMGVILPPDLAAPKSLQHNCGGAPVYEPPVGRCDFAHSATWSSVPPAVIPVRTYSQVGSTPLDCILGSASCVLDEAHDNSRGAYDIGSGFHGASNSRLRPYGREDVNLRRRDFAGADGSVDCCSMPSKVYHFNGVVYSNPFPNSVFASVDTCCSDNQVCGLTSDMPHSSETVNDGITRGLVYGSTFTSTLAGYTHQAIDSRTFCGVSNGTLNNHAPFSPSCIVCGSPEIGTSYNRERRDLQSPDSCSSHSSLSDRFHCSDSLSRSPVSDDFPGADNGISLNSVGKRSDKGVSDMEQDRQGCTERARGMWRAWETIA